MKRVLVSIVAAWYALLAQGAASAPMPDEVVIAGVEFVRVPAGEFWYSVETDYPNRRKYGSAAYREVRVWLDEYYIGKYEARAKDFVRFLNSPAAKTDFIGDPQLREPEREGCAVIYEPGLGYRERFAGTDLPATAVSWDLARVFAEWMGFRLPTEAEWEKAARGTDRRIWPWGNDYPDETYANYAFGVFCAPAPVDAYPKGRSPYGAYNMAGNVAEYTANWFNLAFDQALVNGMRNPPPPKVPAVDEEMKWASRIVKGGRWGTISGSVSIAARDLTVSGVFNDSSGMRFAVDSAVVRSHLLQGTATIVAR